MNQFGFILVAFFATATWADNTEEEGKKYIYEVSTNSSYIWQERIAQTFKAYSLTKADLDKPVKEEYSAIDKQNDYKKATYNKIISFPWKTFKDPVKRMFFLASFGQEALLPSDKKAKLGKVKQDIYAVNDTTKIKEYKSSDGKLKLKYLDVYKKIEKDRSNADEMNYYWKEWFDTVGKQEQNLFIQWAELENDAAHLNGYNDISKLWQAQYEIDSFENTMLQLYKQIEPFFKELHAYIRHKLWVFYGKNDKIVDPKGPIPASLLGSEWEKDLSPLYNLLVPYPKKPLLDIGPALKAKGFTGRKLAEVAERYFVSLGLSKLLPEFWSKSIFEKGDMISCDSDVYDFSNGHDYRVIFCPAPSQDDFTSIHINVGYIEYVMAAKDQPFFFRTPNDAFMIAYKNSIAELSLAPNYLKSLGLLDSKLELDKELEINTLFSQAIYNVFFLPYGLAYDTWRWRVTEGKITAQHFNCEYWKLVTNLQGVEPPVDRDESCLDAGIRVRASSGDEQYIFYYIAIIMKYEIKKGLCKIAGSKEAPVFCDINNSRAVGDKLKEIMPLGSSQPWYRILEKLTGQKTLDASALLEYYQPLFDWLKKENQKNQVTPGWTTGHNRCH